LCLDPLVSLCFGSYNDAAMPIMDSQSLDFISYSYDQTLRYGVKLGQILRSKDTLCLSGQMGAGKTSLAIGIARGWGSLESANSPSYILVNEYTRADGAKLHHMDCYRLNSLVDGDHICIDERLNSGAILMVEWPENIPNLIPERRLWVTIQYVSEEKRSIEVRANGDRYVKLLSEFRKNAFQ
jgi:tRNA threonylcarbamoyladenosine biosynthesis protein TsaE